MTKINDLRSYIEVLSEHGRLSTVEKPVDLVHELADVAATLARQSGKGVIFKNSNNPWD